MKELKTFKFLCDIVTIIKKHVKHLSEFKCIKNIETSDL